MIMNNKALKQFLIESNKAGYASGKEKKWIKEKDRSTTITFNKGDWRSHDNFFGGEPYGGRLVIFYKEKPVWIMVYYGFVVEKVDINEVYKVLRSALMEMPIAYPFRGPKKLTYKKFLYQNTWSGNVNTYSGEEKISTENKIIYTANYFGGLINQRKGL